MLTVELGSTGTTKLSDCTFPSYAIFASVGTEASASYSGQLGAGDVHSGSLMKFVNAVCRFWDNSASSVVVVDLLYVPKTMRTKKWQRRRKHRLSENRR